MVSLSDIEIGSVILNMIEDIPISISGLLPVLVDQEVYFAEKLTGASIGTSAISNEHQTAIISLAAAQVVRLMEMQGVDVSNIKLGDLSVSKGQGSATMVTSLQLREDGIRKLENLGFKLNYYKALG